MRTFALSSGSSGNSFYIESNSGVKILVDLGISYKRTKEILEKKGIDINLIDYVFITHEHSDHSLGILSFLKNNKNCKIFMSKGTFDGLNINNDKIELVKNHSILNLADFKIFVVEKSHDCIEALSYVFENEGKKVGVFTDLGHVSDEIKHILKSLDIIYFEANYCDEFIKSSQKDFSYNYVSRLYSCEGHLSLDDAGIVLSQISNNFQKIILSHISENTNCYENTYLKIKEKLNSIGKFPQIFVSFQGEPTEWFE